MISSPTRSLRHRTSWYTALALAVVFLAPSTAAARYELQDDTPPLVGYSIDGIDGSNGWYRGSSSGAFIVVHWTVTDPDSPVLSTTGCEPAIRIDDPNTGTTRTCSATSSGGTTAVTTKLLKVDATPPSTSVAATTAPNSAGWYRTPVTLQWSATDATSGIASCSPQLTYSSPDTAGTSKSGSCTDDAGNTSAAALTIHYDSTPPTTLGTPSPAPNSKGWLRSPVTVAWSGSDTTSGVASCSAQSGYNGPDTAGATLGGSCTDNAGNSSNGSYTVKYDTHPPATTAAPTTAPNPAGWFRTPVTISAGGTDSLSGVGSCGSTTYGGPDTSGTNTSAACTDNAGNSSSDAYLVKYDATPPAVSSATAERVPDSSGWYNHPVRIDWHGTDPISGVASCSSLTYTAPDDANASRSGGCTDVAGNSSGNSLSFGLRYDSTPPTTLGTPSPAPNSKGWLRSPVTVAWSGSDTTSGVASCSAQSGYNGPDTAGATLGGSCTDNAGNSSNGSYTVKYDTHPPATTAAPTTAPNPAGWFRTPVTISAGGTDSLSGVGSCGSTTYGGPDTSGTNTSAACTDNAGNSSSDAYLVKYDATPPAVSSATAERVPDSSGWYNHPVRIDWHGTDPISGVASCSSLTYTAPDDANASRSGGCTDVAGNSSGNSLSFGLRYDSTPPLATVTAARPADHDGWYTHPVSISWSGTDTTSGIDSCTAPLTYSGPDSGNASSVGHCTDHAGNTASPPALSFRYDATPPSATALPSRPADAGGWYNHRLSVDWGGSDPGFGSGISSCSSYAYGGPDAASVQPSGGCTDKAGNTSAPATFSFRFDATPPTGIAAAPARPPDHDGWYNHPLAVQWSGSDALSGIASCTSADYGDAAAAGPAVLSGGCTDQAGNSSDPLAFDLDYDETPPVFGRLGPVGTRRDRAPALARLRRDPCQREPVAGRRPSDYEHDLRGLCRSLRRSQGGELRPLPLRRDRRGRRGQHAQADRGRHAQADALRATPGSTARRR